MKGSVVVGLTMKSLEYFHWGLGIINNIPADTYNIIHNSGCGYNIEKNNIDNIAHILSQLTIKDIINLKNASRNVYEKFFSNVKFEREIEKFIFKD